MIAWLDADADDQARMRDIIRLFTDRDSRDELGLGQVRDVISDGLFPGTTVLLTRARYLLFVPWCFQLAEPKRDPAVWADRYERTLIATLRKSGSDDLSGLLGARVGQALHTLPSTVYWGTLRHYGILSDEHAWRADVFGRNNTMIAGDDEAARKDPSGWTHGLPAPPAGFPEIVEDAFALSQDEAGWLRDRILDRAPGTLIAHLMYHAPFKESRTPWGDPGVESVRGPAATLLRDAESFSTAMQGASLLYNLLLAEEYEQVVPQDRRRLDAPVDRYREELAGWADRAIAARVPEWDVRSFWAWVYGDARATISPGTELFVSDWVHLLRSIELARLAETPAARQVIRARERRQKRAQARLGNPKRLSNWSGAAGAGALTYRWTTVRDIVLDIHAGLERDA